MNILVLNWRDVTHPKSGGAELVTMEHAKSWVRSGHSVTWVTASYTGALADEIVHGVKILRRFGSLTIYAYVPFYLLLHGAAYDVIVDEVHGFPFFSPVFTKKPVVVFIHEIAGEIWDYMFAFPKNLIGKMLETLYFHMYKNCLFWTIAPSTLKELHAHGIPLANITAIPNSVLVENQWVHDIAWNRKEKNPTYIFVSRVVKMKGIEEVVKAFSFITKEQRDAQMWIVGGGDEAYITELKGMMSEYGVMDKIQFLGRVTDMEKFNLMSRAHILLHASVKEGWGLVVLESSYVGTPAIVYNVSGLRDVVKDGKTGVVLSSNSPQNMASEAIRLFMDRKRYAMYQIRGKQWVDSLKWTDITKKSLRVLEHAIQRRLS